MRRHRSGRKRIRTVIAKPAGRLIVSATSRADLRLRSHYFVCAFLRCSSLSSARMREYYSSLAKCSALSYGDSSLGILANTPETNSSSRFERHLHSSKCVGVASKMSKPDSITRVQRIVAANDDRKVVQIRFTPPPTCQSFLGPNRLLLAAECTQ